MTAPIYDHFDQSKFCSFDPYTNLNQNLGRSVVRELGENCIASGSELHGKRSLIDVAQMFKRLHIFQQVEDSHYLMLHEYDDMGTISYERPP